MIDRMFNSWKTTIIGVIILIGSMALVFLDKASLTEASGFIIAGFGLFFANDNLLGNKKNNE